MRRPVVIVFRGSNEVSISSMLILDRSICEDVEFRSCLEDRVKVKVWFRVKVFVFPFVSEIERVRNA